MSDHNIHHGSCACGAVAYEARGTPTWVAGCCCRDCARATGTPYVVWVGFPVVSVSFQGREPAVHESSTGVLRGYCQDCGTSLTYGRAPEYDVADPLLYVSAATLEMPETCPPTEVVWYSQRPSWFELAPTIA
jgi:hypothetical protein